MHKKSKILHGSFHILSNRASKMVELHSENDKTALQEWIERAERRVPGTKDRIQARILT